MYRHGGEVDLYGEKILYDFSVNTNPIGIPFDPKTISDKLTDLFTHYPKYSDYELLKKEIIDYEKRMYEIDTESKILLGNGASEIIHSLIMMINPKTAVVEAPCFWGYERAIRTSGANILRVKYEDIYEAVKNKKIDLVCLCNPANPTGKLKDLKELMHIADICERNQTQLIVDECFMEFIGDYKKHTLLSHLSEYKCLTIVNAFTKFFCMPGVRLGYAHVSEKIANNNPEDYFCEWNVSSVAIALGIKALSAGEDFRRRTLDILENERSFLIGELKELGMSEISGEANFLFFHSDERLFDELLKRNILIRKCDNYAGLDKHGYYRIAIKTREENSVLIKALKSILKQTDEN